MTLGIHSLTGEEALNLQVGSLGFDEIDFTEQLQEGNMATATYWTGTDDMADSDGDYQVTVTDTQDATLAAFFTGAGELLAAKGSAIAVGDVFQVGGSGDTTDNALQAAKGSAVADNDSFVVTSITTAAVVFVGNLTAAYGWTAAQRSTLYQTAANRSSAGYNLKGLNSKEYQLTYTITEGLAPDGDFALTLEGFGGDTEIIGLKGDRDFTGTPTWANVDLDAYNESGDLTLTDAGTELMPNAVDRDFSGASAWANVDFNAYDETGDLTVTADAIGQYATLVAASAPMTAAGNYRLQLDVANLVETFQIQDFTGAQVLATIIADGTNQTFDFTLDAALTGGFRVVSVAATSSADFDNFSLFDIDQGHYCTLPILSAPMLATEYYQITFDVANLVKTWALTDFTGVQTFATITANGAAQTVRVHIATAITGGFRLVALDPTSSADFDNFTVKHVDLAGAAIEDVITLPHSAGAQKVFFKSNLDADVADFRIVATTTDGTKGALGIDTLTLTRCGDIEVGEADAWWKFHPVEGAATVAAISLIGDNFAANVTTPTLITVPEGQDEIGLFSRITGTSGVIHAYRTSYRA